MLLDKYNESTSRTNLLIRMLTDWETLYSYSGHEVRETLKDAITTYYVPTILVGYTVQDMQNTYFIGEEDTEEGELDTEMAKHVMQFHMLKAYIVSKIGEAEWSGLVNTAFELLTASQMSTNTHPTIHKVLVEELTELPGMRYTPHAIVELDVIMVFVTFCPELLNH